MGTNQMNYELAKQLKDAGFQQKGSNGFPGIMNIDGDQELYYPSLEELIEACGDKFDRLERWDDTEWRVYMTEEAFANSDNECSVVECCGYDTGLTPEQAVARLWLNLNEVQ